MNESVCKYEIESCGVPSSLYSVSRLDEAFEAILIYGTMEGKVALIKIYFNQTPLKVIHKWKISGKETKAPVTCLSMMEDCGELYIGRSDGSIEIWVLIETIEANGSQIVSFKFN